MQHMLLRNGHLEVLQWARNNGCEWDSKHVQMLLKMGIWKCYNGPGIMDANGIVGHVRKLQKMGIWKCFNGPEIMDVIGILIHAHMRQKMERSIPLRGIVAGGFESLCDTNPRHLEVLQWARENGCDGIVIHAHMLLGMGIWMCSNGRGTMDANGMVIHVHMLRKMGN